MNVDTDKVRETIAKTLAVPLDEVVDDASIRDGLGADSLDLVEVVMAMEEEFSIRIPDEDAERLNTVAEVITYLQGTVQ